MNRYLNKLENIYASVIESNKNNKKGINQISGKHQKQLDIIIDRSENSKGVLAVLITLSLEKLISPTQDIRLHQAGMKNGFSGRGLDTRIVTPFLKKHNFPNMSESGWLTRSLEQDHPYNKNYPGKITPESLKKAFLEIVDAVQSEDLSAEKVLFCLFLGLVRQRDRNKSLRLSRPINLSNGEIIERLKFHFSSTEQGTSRLPVLAVYAIYKQMVGEMDRYKDMTLLELESHTASDEKTGLLGDVQVVDESGTPIEVIEIKHNIPITPQLLQDCYKKFKKTQVRNFYLLSTNSVLSEEEKIQDLISDIYKNHGCRVIVNGINETLSYYLRLIKDTTAFVNAYVSLVEKDPVISYSLRKKWDALDKDHSG